MTLDSVTWSSSDEIGCKPAASDTISALGFVVTLLVFFIEFD